jgi:YD repeat-containing protein
MKTFFQKTVLVLAFTSVAFVACKKSEDAKPDTCSLTKFQEGSSSASVFEYDTQDRLVKSTQDGGAVSTYEYNSNNKLSKYSYLRTAPTYYDEYTEYTHTTNLISAKRYKRYKATDSYVQQTPDTQYELDAQGRLTKTIYGPTEYWRYEYNADGNVLKAYFFFAQNTQNKERLEAEYTSYDTKKNPLYENEALRITYYTYNGSPFMSKNNVLKGNRSYNFYDFTYTYNEKNYLLTSKNNLDITSNATSTFEYKCK